MKYIITFIFTLSFLTKTNAQNNTICAVKYKDLKTSVVLGTYNHWFLSNKSISVKVPNNRAIYMRGFPVLINNVMTTQNDTVKYNQEFNEFVNERAEEEKKRSTNVWMKMYNSEILQMTYHDNNANKNYIVVDSLGNMNNWEILNDTATFMGFKCQKAVINYKQDTYTAWFTTQLAYNAGPDGFSGLPGLILKISNSTGKLGYEAIEVQTPFKGVIPEFKNTGEFISKKEWQVIINEKNGKMRESLNNMINEYKKQTTTPKH